MNIFLHQRAAETGFVEVVPFSTVSDFVHECGCGAPVGVDDPGPRRLPEGAGFNLIADAGLGGSPENYDDILTHSFPSGLKAEDSWEESLSPSVGTDAGLPPYADLQKRLAETSDLTDAEIRCGMVDLAGTGVGAAFVGCVAATLVLSEVLRTLAGGPRFEVLSVSLRSSHKLRAVRNRRDVKPMNPGFAYARTRVPKEA